MVHCVVFGCSNKTKTKRDTRLSFFRFPQGERRNVWTQAIRRENWSPNNYSFVCSDHFSSDQINSTYPSGLRLRENAVPNIFPSYPEYLKPNFKPEIGETIRKHGFYVVQYNRCIMDLPHARMMYSEHEGKTFYKRLIEMMTSGPIDAFLLARENGIKRWRTLMGPTRTLEAQFLEPTSLRGVYGLSNTRNATHGSDSPCSVFKEAAVFFPSFDIVEWYEKEEEYFRNGYVKYCEEVKTHIIDHDAPCGLKSP